MAKIITEEQIKAIVDAFWRLNTPVQDFEALRKLLSELPEAKDDKKK